MQNTTKPSRKCYTSAHREQARRYYLMGLNLTEIGKLLDGCPVRTLEKWQVADQWTKLKNPDGIKNRAFEMHKAGRTYKEIGETLKISAATVWRYIDQTKRNNESKRAKKAGI